MLDFQPVLIDGRDTLVDGLPFQRNYDFGMHIAGCPWYRNSNRPCFPDDLGHLARVQLKAGVDQAKPALTKIEYSIGGAHHFTVFRYIDASSDCNRRMAIDRATEVDRVAADIHERATGKLSLQTYLLHARGKHDIEGKRGSHQLDRTNAAFIYLLQRPDSLWMETVHEGLH